MKGYDWYMKDGKNVMLVIEIVVTIPLLILGFLYNAWVYSLFGLFAISLNLLNRNLVTKKELKTKHNTRVYKRENP